MLIVSVVILRHGYEIKTPVYVYGGGAFVFRQDPVRLSVDMPRGPTNKSTTRKDSVLLRGIPTIVSRIFASGISRRNT